MTKSALLTAALLAITSTAALADPTPRVDRREANQLNRIDHGIRSGELNARETSRLLAGQAHVYRMESRAKADGVMTARERDRLRHAQNVQSRRIYREKHD
jgi:hypothetical protein